jgi:hypothetical protein
LTIDILTYIRSDSATDVMGIKAKAACFRTSEAFPTAAIAPGSMNINKDIQNPGPPMPGGEALCRKWSQSGIASLGCGLQRQAAIEWRLVNNLHS